MCKAISGSCIPISMAQGAATSAHGLPDVLRSSFISPPLPATGEEITADAPPTPQVGAETSA